MSTAELKLQITNQINSFDDEKLKQFYAVLIQFINNDSISKKQNQGILDALDEMKSFNGIDHTIIIEKYKSKYD